jgi:predicted RNase H-like HicB family nuclease
MERYAIVIEKAASNYAGYVPDVPGCVAKGNTVEGTERLLREAIEMHLEGMREYGIPAPEPSSQVHYVEVNARAKKGGIPRARVPIESRLASPHSRSTAIFPLHSSVPLL